MVRLLTILAFLFAGCQSEVTKVPVTGSVTFDGEPVETGQIAFQLVGAGKVEVTTISNGKYAFPEEFGLKPGEHIVRITGDRPTGRTAQTDSFVTAEDSLEIYEQFIPAKYNTASELTATVDAGSKQMTLDFELKAN